MNLHEHLPAINLQFYFPFVIHYSFFPPFRPHMLTDVNLQGSTMILPTKVVCFLALLC